MRIEHTRTLAGPNVYTHRPALLMRLHLESLTGRESCDVPGFVERLLAALPGLAAHHCSREHPGGFVERLREGTFFGHVVEHIALELMALAEVGTKHGKTRRAEAPGVYNVVVEYRAEEGTKFLLGAAVELVDAFARGEAYPLEAKLKEAKALVGRTELGPSTRAIVEAAGRRGIPWRRVGPGNLVQLGWGVRRRFIEAAISDRTSAIAVDVSCDKDLTKLLLDEASIPVPRGRIVRTEHEAVAALGALGAPVVVKPLDGRQGLGVSLNLSTPAEVRGAFQVASAHSLDVLVEELVRGRNYRALVVGGRLIAASERLPSRVTGDGARTIAELIDRANEDPLRGEGHEKPLTKICVDEIVLAHLRKHGRSLGHVPAAGEIVTLRESVNLSTGGSAVDVTDEVHPTVRDLCERAARLLDMDICGVDLVLEDISAPFAGGRGAIIEVNASPGLRMHLHPSAGRARDVGGAIIDTLYPAGAGGRVPLISVTGTNGKTTVTRMIGHAVGAAGQAVGVTTTDGIWIGGKRMAEGDTTGPQSARAVLSDPAVEVAVLETARGGIVRRGLGYDWSDISVITNIQPDHFGQDGIEDLDDLVFVKSLVAERVREGGTLVLNADDERLARLMEIRRVARTPKRVVYFSLHENHLLIRRHTDAGGTAYFVCDGHVIEAVGAAQERLFEVARIPATMGGTAEFQAANVLAATAACRAHGLAAEQIAAALATFSSAGDNGGRASLYRVASGGYVLLDYGHNPDAFRAVCRMTARWQGRRVTGIVGAPGDRSDALIEEAGRIAARGFERIIIREDKDLRGRAPGEVPRLLCASVAAEVPGRECRVVPDEAEALRRELEVLRAGEVVVIFYEKLGPLLSVLGEFGAEPVPGLEGLAARAAAAHATAHTYDGTASSRTAAVGVRRAAARRRADGERFDGHSYVWR